MENEVVILTRQEIGDAITNYIGIFKRGMAFFPFCIDHTDTELLIPETVMFHLNYVPRGSKSKDFQHKI